MMIFRSHVARTPKQCNGVDPETLAACPRSIESGERYWLWAVPPWMDYETDVDDEGRTVGILRDESERTWQTFRTHTGCML